MSKFCKGSFREAIESNVEEVCNSSNIACRSSDPSIKVLKGRSLLLKRSLYKLGHSTCFHLCKFSNRSYTVFPNN